MAASLTDAPFAPAPAGVGGDRPRQRRAGRADLGPQRRAAVSVAAAARAAAERAARLHHDRTPTSGAWRVFSTLAGGQVVQVAQPMSARRELAASMALRTIVPLLLALPVLGAVDLVHHRARPDAARSRRRCRRDDARRRCSSRSPKRGLPREVQPLVGALNGSARAPRSRARRAALVHRRCRARIAHAADRRAPAGAARRARDDRRRARAPRSPI